jgi:Lipid A 3-O-deacylase (PagL)
MFSTGVSFQYGFIFAHSEAVENTKGSYPMGTEIIFSWQRNDSAMWNLCNCYPRKGLLMSYFNYDNEVLGHSFTAAYFLEPTYKIGKNTFFSFRIAGGLSYLTNPFDTIYHPNNRSYSTRINAYLLFGLGVWFRLDDHWWLNPSINYNHESNGGMKQPNSGINWPTAGLALSFQKNPRPYFTGTRYNEKYWRSNSIRWDIGLFGTARRVLDKNGDSKRLPLVGLLLQGGKQVGRINVLTLGTEIFADRGLHFEFRRDSLEASSMKVGILAGHEFILGNFLFSQRLGLYVFDQTPHFDQLYHRWGLLYRVNNNLGVGVSLSAHRHIADFSDLRVTYTFQKKS